ncbi:TPA: hypothetical protein ACS7XC_001506 [Providencia alcalifaciens]
MSFDALAFITIMTTLVLGVVVFFAYAINDIICTLDANRLGRDIKSAIMDHDLDFEDFKNLQEIHKVSDKAAINVLKRIKGSNDSGNDPNRVIIKDRIEFLLATISKEEPFSDLPLDVRDSLIQASKLYKDSKAISNLADSLREYIKKQNKVDLKLKVSTYVSTVIGIIGLIWGFFK